MRKMLKLCVCVCVYKCHIYKVIKSIQNKYATYRTNQKKDRRSSHLIWWYGGPV